MFTTGRYELAEVLVAHQVVIVFPTGKSHMRQSTTEGGRVILFQIAMGCIEGVPAQAGLPSSTSKSHLGLEEAAGR